MPSLDDPSWLSCGLETRVSASAQRVRDTAHTPEQPRAAQGERLYPGSHGAPAPLHAAFTTLKHHGVALIPPSPDAPRANGTPHGRGRHCSLRRQAVEPPSSGIFLKLCFYLTGGLLTFREEEGETETLMQNRNTDRWPPTGAPTWVKPAPWVSPLTPDP